MLFQFESRPGLSRRDVIHEAIQVANIADLVRTTKQIFYNVVAVQIEQSLATCWLACINIDETGQLVCLDIWY